MEKALPTQTPFPSAHINQILHVRSYPRYLSWFQVSLKSVEKCELWGVEISAFPLTWHIAYTTACCYRTNHDYYYCLLCVRMRRMCMGRKLMVKMMLMMMMMMKDKRPKSKPRCEPMYCFHYVLLFVTQHYVLQNILSLLCLWYLYLSALGHGYLSNARLCKVLQTLAKKSIDSVIGTWKIQVNTRHIFLFVSELAIYDAVIWWMCLIMLSGCWAAAKLWSKLVGLSQLFT